MNDRITNTQGSVVHRVYAQSKPSSFNVPAVSLKDLFGHTVL